MTQADHYRDQSIRAQRLARAVKDPEASRKLSEMAEEFRLYAERLEKTLDPLRCDAYARWNPVRARRPSIAEWIPRDRFLVPEVSTMRPLRDFTNARDPSTAKCARNAASSAHCSKKNSRIGF